MTSSVVGPRRSFQALPKVKLTPKKRSWSLFGGLLPVWSTTAFWIPAKPLHLRSMLSKLIRCTQNCLQPILVNRKSPVLLQTMPDCKLNNQHFGSWANWATKVCFICIFTWPLVNQLPLFQASRQLFTGKIRPQPAGGRKYFPRVHWIPKHRFLCYRNKLISPGKNVLIVMVPILSNKGVFEPSYNDLKFTVWNCNYICTHLMYMYHIWYI